MAAQKLGLQPLQVKLLIELGVLSGLRLGSALRYPRPAECDELLRAVAELAPIDRGSGFMSLRAFSISRKIGIARVAFLLNLVLSTLAAFQAPIIMMSQRRQEEKDRLRAENDYRVNLKAELEIRQLHEKIDHQLSRQWEKLAELQKIQIDLLEANGQQRR